MYQDNAYEDDVELLFSTDASSSSPNHVRRNKRNNNAKTPKRNKQNIITYCILCILIAALVTFWIEFGIALNQHDDSYPPMNAVKTLFLFRDAGETLGLM